MLKVLQKYNPSLEALGKDDISKANQEATRFILHCYGQHNILTLTDARKRIWKDLVFRASLKDKRKAPGLYCLPPTEEAL